MRNGRPKPLLELTDAEAAQLQSFARSGDPSQRPRGGGVDRARRRSPRLCILQPQANAARQVVSSIALKGGYLSPPSCLAPSWHAATPC
ncbi:hypothetical protein, partial [Xanthomonas theicola]|uniref:hypothetical protein n=1 Tax=Xanthomonas theicola TaxID=56464 RepID=UPI001B8071DB